MAVVGLEFQPDWLATKLKRQMAWAALVLLAATLALVVFPALCSPSLMTIEPFSMGAPTVLVPFREFESSSLQPTEEPTFEPSREDLGIPSNQPTHQPLADQPSRFPTESTDDRPTEPFAQPSPAPTSLRSGVPSLSPSVKPIISPTQRPTAVPTLTSKPTAAPSFQAQPVVSVNAAMTFSGAQSTELTVDDQLIVRQALLQSLQGTVSGLTLDNVVYLYAEAARRALAIAATEKTKAKTSASTQSVSVLVHCAVVLPIVDFPQYSSNVTALSQSVSSQITTSANDGSLLAAVQTLAAASGSPSASIFNGVTGLEVSVSETVQQPPTFFPTAAPTRVPRHKRRFSGSAITLLGVALMLVLGVAAWLLFNACCVIHRLTSRKPKLSVKLELPRCKEDEPEHCATLDKAIVQSGNYEEPLGTFLVQD